MNRLQYVRPTDLEAFQLHELKRLLAFAITNVPFYSRKLRDADLNSLEKLSDLSNFALTSKDELRAHFEGAVAPALKHRGILRYTSGSTGKPFSFYEDRSSIGLTIASRFFFDSLTTARADDARVRIAGQAHFWPAVIFNEKQIPLTSVTPRSARAILESINVHRPSLLICPPSAAAILSEHPLPNPGLRWIITTGENLTDSLRAKIESRWRTVVQNRYGLRETGGYMAQECMDRKGLHVNAVRAIVEIVQNGRMAAPGEKGEIVITDLHNYVMPFIRYRTGDMAEQGGTCTCGNAFPTVRKIVGRSVEYLRAKDGNLIPLSGFSDKFGALFVDDVVQFQFVDRGVGNLVVKIVPTQRFSQTRQRIMEQWLRSVADKVEIETVDSVPITSGKVRALEREDNSQIS